MTPSVATCVLIVAVLVALLHQRPERHVERHPNRRYGSFTEFWPHYVAEHSLPLTKLLHAAGTSAVTVVAPLRLHGPSTFVRLNLGIAAGMSLALLIAPDATAQFSNGAAEALIMATSVVGCAVAFSGLSVKSVLCLLAVGYVMPWVAHFFVERNRPATFLHPTFSLVGDFRLMAEMVTLQLDLNASST